MHACDESIAIKTYSIYMMCRWWWATCWTPSSTFAYNTIAIVIIARRRWWRCCGAEQSKHLFRWDWPFFVNVAVCNENQNQTHTKTKRRLKKSSLYQNKKLVFFSILTHVLMTIHLPMMNWCHHFDLTSMCLYSVCEMMRNPNMLHDLGANRLSVYTIWQNDKMTKWHTFFC